MPSPLTQDVLDVIKAVNNASELMLLRPLTPTGRKLRDAVLGMRKPLVDQLGEALHKQVAQAAEVEGLRAQNAQLTEVLQRTEAELAFTISREVFVYDARPEVRQGDGYDFMRQQIELMRGEP